MKTNQLIIAAAGSGKTTFLVNEALKVKDSRILITTYTLANESEIKKKIIKINRCIPSNIVIQPWFSFLLQHGVKPYQGHLFDMDICGLEFVQEQSAHWFTNKQGIKIFYPEEGHFQKHYFTKSLKIYSDKLSKFVVRCNEKSQGAVIDRLSRIYSHIFIDEVQDIAGYDLDLLKLLFKSNSSIILVGDPRQVTYLTHHESKYTKYKDGRIKDFIINECKKDRCEIKEDELNKSFRNNSQICEFACKLYPIFSICESAQSEITDHEGIFLIRKKDVEKYIERFSPMQLRYDIRCKDINSNYPIMNFGESKGLTFSRVLIYPTNTILQYLKDGILTKPIKKKKGSRLIIETKAAFDIAKFYVAVTRAEHSVGIVCDYNTEDYIEGIGKYTLVTI